MSIAGGDLDNTIATTVSTNGTTTLTRASATTTWTAYPSSAGNDISMFAIEVDIDVSGGRRVWVSTNNAGVNYTVLAPGDSITFEPKSVKQIYVRTASSTATFSLWMDFVE